MAGSPSHAAGAELVSNDAVVIAAARRTPLGGFQGALSPLSGHQLAAAVFAAVLEDSHVAAEEVSEVFLGCVLPAGQGQAPARQAALGAGLPTSVPCTTINKVCGSGMKSLMLGHDLIRAGSADIVLVGGTESMTNAPYLLPKEDLPYIWFAHILYSEDAWVKIIKSH